MLGYNEACNQASSLSWLGQHRGGCVSSTCVPLPLPLSRAVGKHINMLGRIEMGSASRTVGASPTLTKSLGKASSRSPLVVKGHVLALCPTGLYRPRHRLQRAGQARPRLRWLGLARQANAHSSCPLPRGARHVTTVSSRPACSVTRECDRRLTTHQHHVWVSGAGGAGAGAGAG